MNFIAKSAPDIDPANLRESLQGFRDYMVDTLELIDFTLGNQKNRINGAVSQQNFETLAAQVSSISSNLTAITVMISTLNGRISDLSDAVESVQDSMNTAEGNITSLDSRLDTAESSITSLDSRMSGA